MQNSRIALRTNSCTRKKMRNKLRLFNNILIFVHLVLISNNGATSDKINTDKKIIIIGAGAAGIAAASKLFENGFQNVRILEAENRIGGRLYTTKLGNYSVDLGAQWVHGERDNVAFNMAYPLGLLDTTNQTVVNLKLFDSSGNPVSENMNENIKSFIDKYFTEGVTKDVHDNTDTYSGLVEQSYQQEFQSNSEMLKNKNGIIHLLELQVLSTDAADSWNDLSLTDTGGYIVQDGDQEVNWKTRGYGTILDILMKRYPNPEKELPILNNTIFNAEVTLIDYTYSKNGHSVMVTTKDSMEYETDHVIVTVSLGVLKAQHKSFFIPPLPSKKIEAIEAMGFGSAGKVYFLFEEPFWRSEENVTHFGFLWNDADRKAIENDPEKMWVLGVEGAQPVEHKENLLEFYITSKWAKAMEVVPENKVYDQTFELLQWFMGKRFNVSKPIAMMRTQWYTNPHFRGTYSYRSVESERRHILPQILQEPINLENPKVLFAGEATSTHRYSTADGAIESGWMAAESLINFYKIE